MTRAGLRPGDDRGAIMVIALFFAVFAVAMLYSLIGTAEAITFREDLQDQADRAALSSAILHARSMNLIVLINIVMAALLAILVAMKLVEGLAILGMAVALGLAWLTGGGTLAAVPPLTSIQQTMHELFETTKEPVFQALTVLHDTADAVKDIAPLADGAVASHPGLPLTDDSFDHLCGKSGELAAELWLMPLDGIPWLEKLDLGGAAGAVTSRMSDYFCGDSSGGPPSYTREVEQSSPHTDEDAACETGALEGEGKAATSRECDERQAYLASAKPDGTTGSCRTGEDCSATGPYETRAKLAREQCDPEQTPGLYRFIYQKRHGYAEYEWDGEAWRLVERRYDSPRRVDTKDEPGLPCGPKERNPVVAVGYNKTVRESSDVNELRPVCSTELLPVLLPGQQPKQGDRTTVEFDEVSHLLGCVKKIEESVGFGDDTMRAEGGDSKAPKIIPEEVWLGDEEFQLRSLVQGDTEALRAGRIVRLALWSEPEPDEPLAALRPLTSAGFAQAEYFYDGEDDREAWMWNMKWRGRLVRFRLPEEPADGAPLARLCASSMKPSSDCTLLLGSLRALENVLAH